MRLWSLHPQYLDAAGLVALWREALLAQAVLRGATRGYRQHPQLERFREQSAPLSAIALYLRAVHEEATQRGYQFDRKKIAPARKQLRLIVSEGQLQYEWEHLLQKLARRQPALRATLDPAARPQAHPLFQVVPGGIASWERPAPSENG